MKMQNRFKNEGGTINIICEHGDYVDGILRTIIHGDCIKNTVLVKIPEINTGIGKYCSRYDKKMPPPMTFRGNTMKNIYGHNFEICGCTRKQDTFHIAHNATAQKGLGHYFVCGVYLC